MKKLLLLSIIIVTTSCTSTKITVDNAPKDRFSYPFYTEGRKPIDEAWTKIADLMAIEGINAPEHQGKGTFSIHFPNVSYTFEDDKGKVQDTTALIILPRVRDQEVSGNRVKSSRKLFPDSVSISFNVRVRPNTRGGTFINVNIPTIDVAGAHYRKRLLVSSASSPKSFVFPDTAVVRVPVIIKKSDWDGARSSGVLERYFINLIEKTDLGKYNDHPRLPR